VHNRDDERKLASFVGEFDMADVTAE